MKIRFAITATATALVAIGIGSTIGVSSATGNNNFLPQGSPGIAPEAVVEILGPVTSRSAGVVPDFIDLSQVGVGGVDAVSLRLLGDADGIQYWTGSDAVGNICVMSVIVEQSVAAAACNTPATVEKSGLWVGVIGDASKPGYREVAALLLPDSAAEHDALVLDSAAEHGVHVSDSLTGKKSTSAVDPWKHIAPNLIVADLSDVESTTTTVPRSAGGDPIELTIE